MARGYAGACRRNTPARKASRDPYVEAVGPYGSLIRKAYRRFMGLDLLMVVLMVGFFLLAAVFVVWLDRI
jgi:hypothetical protein